MHQRITRGASAVSVAAAAALLLAACSSDADTEETTSPAADASASASASADTTGDAAAFPVTLDTAMGEVTIDAEPQRVVTLGSHEHEYLYALGVAPVAVPVSWQGYENGTGPWADADREAAGATPELFEPGTTTYDAEAIAAFEPDLIVATYPNHEMTQEEYTLLSGIAPVVTRPATDSEGNATVEWGVTLEDEPEPARRGHRHHRQGRGDRRRHRRSVRRRARGAPRVGGHDLAGRRLLRGPGVRVRRLGHPQPVPREPGPRRDRR
ncbi:hypothetical protein GCM10025876_11740 [Demequina litorisediminis]|uniref:Periplasmic binding protein n=1 Tax=Demequina litorisediminis TaxID=1849022 RepID=A0ABQ6IB64_9MICO|nr:ABC transporter substrate-binding protein [Demequina litorisediminis]GMA34970.1 hypothetical protein GCM10025876_11740 [Demequina litorisediminis]